MKIYIFSALINLKPILMKNSMFKIIAAVVLLFATITIKAGVQEDLIAACKSGNLEAVQKALDAGAQVNALDDKGNPAIASAFLWPDITKLLLAKSADPNLGTYPALISAGTFSSVDVMKLLLDAGADPNKAGLSDPTTTFKTLIANEKAKGATANQAMISAWTSAMTILKPSEVFALPTLIASSNCAACAEMLLAKGAKMDKGVTDGTLLHTFANYGNSAQERKKAAAAGKAAIEGFGYALPDWYLNMPDDRNGSADAMVKLLVSKGLDINGKNKANGIVKPQTPLEVALATGFGTKKEVMLAMINNGADVKIVNDNFGSLIIQASQTGFTEVVIAMKDKGADINAEADLYDDNSKASVKGFTSLTVAAMKNNLDLVKYLIGAGAKSNEGIHGLYAKNGCVTTISGKTAIYFAIENANIEMVKFLAESGEKWWKRLKIHDKKKKLDNGVYTTYSCFDVGEYTPSMYAKENKQDEMKSYLKSKGL